MDSSEAIRNLKNTQVRFILTELRAGLTFTSVAENRGRNAGQSRAHARAAYDSVLRSINRVTLTREESEEVRGKLETLKKRLESLGERL